MQPRLTLSPALACLALSLCISGFLGGCSSDDTTNTSTFTNVRTFSCQTNGPCLDDPMPSADETAACQDLLTDAVCGVAFKTYTECTFTAAKCTDAGLSDPTADSTSNECAASYAAYTTCIVNKDAGAATSK